MSRSIFQSSVELMQSQLALLMCVHSIRLGPSMFIHEGFRAESQKTSSLADVIRMAGILVKSVSQLSYELISIFKAPKAIPLYVKFSKHFSRDPDAGSMLSVSKTLLPFLASY